MNTSLKETSMTFRLETNLRDSFADAARFNHRPAAQVLRDFMRQYVEATRSRSAGITPDDRRRRQQAVDYARASVGLEGFDPGHEEAEIASRFINGDIDINDFLNRSDNGAATER